MAETETKKKSTLIKTLLLLSGNATALTLIYSYLDGKLIKEAKEKVSNIGKGISKLAKGEVTDWSISLSVNGKTYTFSNPDVFLYGSILSLLLIVLIQVVIDKQPWNSLFTKQLSLYLLISFGIIGLLVFVGMNWLTAMNPVVFFVAGTAIGYLIFRITKRIGGKPEKLP